MKKITTMLTIAVLMCSSAFAEKPSEESVRQLMDKVGAGKLGVQVMQQMLPNLKKMIPNAPEEFWSDVMKEVTPEGLVQQIVPIYQKHLSQTDVDNLSAFYDTETGKKLIAVQPIIVRESMLAGQQWGGDIAKKVIETYKKRYEQNEPSEKSENSEQKPAATE